MTLRDVLCGPFTPPPLFALARHAEAMPSPEQPPEDEWGPAFGLYAFLTLVPIAALLVAASLVAVDLPPAAFHEVNGYAEEPGGGGGTVAKGLRRSLHFFVVVVGYRSSPAFGTDGQIRCPGRVADGQGEILCAVGRRPRRTHQRPARSTRRHRCGHLSWDAPPGPGMVVSGRVGVFIFFCCCCWLVGWRPWRSVMPVCGCLACVLVAGIATATSLSFGLSSKCTPTHFHPPQLPPDHLPPTPFFAEVFVEARHMRGLAAGCDGDSPEACERLKEARARMAGAAAERAGEPVSD